MERVEMPSGGRPCRSRRGRWPSRPTARLVVRLGDTVVLATACAPARAAPGIDFLPLTVDYRENTYAAGKIPGGFFKREGRPNEKEILTSPHDRPPATPAVPGGLAPARRRSSACVLSADLENDSDTLAITGRLDRALHLGDPVRARRSAPSASGYLGRRACVVNPGPPTLKTKSQLNLLVAGTEEAIVMVEAGANEVSEAVMVERAGRGPRRRSSRSSRSRRSCAARVGKPKRPFAHEGARRRRSRPRSRARSASRCPRRCGRKGKLESYAPHEEGARRVRGHDPRGARPKSVRRCLRSTTGCARRSCARDPRAPAAPRRPRLRRDPRRSRARSGVLPRTHGSALFTRGETQALVTVTLGTSEDAQIIDTVLEGEYAQAVHAPLQLPALLGRRGEVPARPRPARDRPRRAGGAGASRACCPPRRTSPTPSASSPTSSSRTARPRWPPSAAARSR